MALSTTTQDNVLLNIHELPSKINEGNQSLMELANSIKVNSRMKHVDARHHFNREKIASREIELHCCPTEEMLQIF